MPNPSPGDSNRKVNSASRRRLVDAGDIFLALCVVLFVVFLVDTYEMERVSSYLLPRLICIFGIVVGTLKLIVTHLKPRSTEAELNQELSGGKGLPVGFSIVFVAAYFLATLWLGFILSTAVAMLLFSYFMRYPRKRLSLVLSITVPLILHLAFVTLLQASLPAGIVEDLLF